MKNTTPISASFKIMYTSPMPYYVVFWYEMQGGYADETPYNYFIETPYDGEWVKQGIFEGPFTMNAAMTILQEYLDSKKDD